MINRIECDLAPIKALGERKVARKLLGDLAQEPRSMQQSDSAFKPLNVGELDHPPKNQPLSAVNPQLKSRQVAQADGRSQQVGRALPHRATRRVSLEGLEVAPV